MNILLQLLLILFLAKIFGEIIERSGFPSTLGEILAGLFLGTFFASFILQPDSEIIPFFAELGAIFLLFTAGYKEVHISELKAATKIALIPTLGGVAVPFAFGYILGNAFGFGFLESLFMGVAFSPTSIGVVVKTLIDFDYLSSKPGSLMLTSAIFDDIIGLFLLAVVVTIATYDKLPTGMQLLIIATKIIVFLLIMAILGSKVFLKIFTYIHRMHVKESIFSFVVMIALFSAYLAEVFGLHAVIGAFIGGVLISDIPFAKLEDVQSKVSGFAYGIFVPFFFAFIGLSVDISVVKTAGLFAILVVILALSGKLIGGFIGTKLIGFDSRDSLIFGVGVMPRAGVELVIISIGREMGIIGGEVFSAIVLMVAVSVVVSPAMLKFAIESKERAKAVSS